VTRKLIEDRLHSLFTEFVELVDEVDMQRVKLAEASALRLAAPLCFSPGNSYFFCFESARGSGDAFCCAGCAQRGDGAIPTIGGRIGAEGLQTNGHECN
jgi:hypothetical protein